MAQIKEEKMKNNQNVSKWMYLAAVLMFAAAVLQITNDKFILGAIFFGSAVCFMAAARKYHNKEADESDRKN